MLSSMVRRDYEGSIKCFRDEDGSVFIDRNGKIFEVGFSLACDQRDTRPNYCPNIFVLFYRLHAQHILEYLRIGTLQIPKKIQEKAFFRELEYYAIPYERLCQPSSIKEARRAWRDEARAIIETNADTFLKEITEKSRQGQIEVRFQLKYDG